MRQLPPHDVMYLSLPFHGLFERNSVAIFVSVIEYFYWKYVKRRFDIIPSDGGAEDIREFTRVISGHKIRPLIYNMFL